MNRPDCTLCRLKMITQQFQGKAEYLMGKVNFTKMDNRKPFVLNARDVVICVTALATGNAVETLFKIIQTRPIILTCVCNPRCTNENETQTVSFKSLSNRVQSSYGGLSARSDKFRISFQS